MTTPSENSLRSERDFYVGLPVHVQVERHEKDKFRPHKFLTQVLERGGFKTGEPPDEWYVLPTGLPSMQTQSTLFSVKKIPTSECMIVSPYCRGEIGVTEIERALRYLHAKSQEHLHNRWIEPPKVFGLNVPFDRSKFSELKHIAEYYYRNERFFDQQNWANDADPEAPGIRIQKIRSAQNLKELRATERFPALLAFSGMRDLTATRGPDGRLMPMFKPDEPIQGSTLQSTPNVKIPDSIEKEMQQTKYLTLIDRDSAGIVESQIDFIRMAVNFVDRAERLEEIDLERDSARRFAVRSPETRVAVMTAAATSTNSPAALVSQPHKGHS